MATIKDVARLAGVSVSAVSKVLNDYSDIGPDAREKVLRAVAELGYSANVVAKKLSQKQSRTIGLILANLGSSDGKDGILFNILSGVYAAAARAGYEVYAVDGHSLRKNRKDYDGYCAEHKFAGVIAQGLRSDDAFFAQIGMSERPTVAIDFCAVGKNLSTVGVDNRQAAKDAVTALIARGYRNIGMLNGSPQAAVSRERYEGYRAALAAADLDWAESALMECGYSERRAYLETEAYLNANPQLDAVFCASDLMAAGFIARCRELSVRVPQDIAVMGFDDIALCEYMTPRLSTVRQDMRRNGERALETLIEMIEHGVLPQRLVLPHEIVLRESI